METLDFDQWESKYVDTDLDFPVLYKLTDGNDCTFGNTKWGKNITHTAPGQVVSKDDGKVINSKPSLCSCYWLHAYAHPVMAVLLSPLHVDFERPNLWVCTGDAKIMASDGKIGCTKLTTHERVVCPIISETTRLCWGMACLAKVYEETAYKLWSSNWINGKERECNIDHMTVGHYKEKFAAEKINRMRGTANYYYEVWAAKQLASAAVQMIHKNDRALKIVCKNSASAAVVAKKISLETNRSFDLAEVAEEVMAAK